MQLIEFSIAEDFISLQRGNERFDLHNNFDFDGLSFHPVEQTLELRWRRGEDVWVPTSEPASVSLLFAGVYLFKASERDSALPFTEDSCLDSIGFMWDDLIDEMRAFTSNQPGAGCTHLTANFMSGFSIKVGAASVTMRLSGGA